MRPKPYLIGALAYLMLVTVCPQPARLSAQAPLVTRAAPLSDPNLPAAQSGQRIRLSDQEPSASINADMSDQAWTSAAPRPLPSAANLPPLPGSMNSSMNPSNAQPSQNRATMQPSTQLVATQPAHTQPAPTQLAPMPGAGQVVQAQYTGSEVPPPESLRSSGSKPVSLANAQSSYSETQADASSITRPLKPRSQTSDAASSSTRSTGTVQMIVSVISSLLIVVALLLGAAWCYRKAAPTLNGTLPKDAVQMLGRTTIAPRQQLMVIRFGTKILLVSNLQGEVRTLSEIDDPLEVDRIAGLCESAQAGSISHSFRTVLHNLGGANE